MLFGGNIQLGGRQRERSNEENLLLLKCGKLTTKKAQCVMSTRLIVYNVRGRFLTGHNEMNLLSLVTNMSEGRIVHD